jgi:hypothetical protein
MSSITPLPPTSDWSRLPTAAQDHIFGIIQNYPCATGALELTCHSWRQHEFRKATPNKEGHLDLSIYPNITDGDTRFILEMFKQAEVRFSKWEKFVNCLSCNPREETILVTSIDLSNCKKITDKTLKAMEGLSIKTLKIKGCKNVTGEGLKSVKKMPLHTLVLDRTRLGSDDLGTLKGISSLKELSIRKCKNIQHLMEIRGVKIELVDCRGTQVVGITRKLLPKATIRLK